MKPRVLASLFLGLFLAACGKKEDASAPLTNPLTSSGSPVASAPNEPATPTNATPADQAAQPAPATPVATPTPTPAAPPVANPFAQPGIFGNPSDAQRTAVRTLDTA